MGDAVDDPPEVVAALLRKHLLRRDGARFALLGVIRGFVRTCDPDGCTADFARRHGDWCVAEAQAGRVRVDELVEAHAALAEEEPARAVEAALLALPTLYLRGPRATHAALIERCAAHAERAAPDRRARVWLHRAALRRSRGELEAAEADAGAALALAEAEGDATLALDAWITRADIARYAGRLDAADALYARGAASCPAVEPAAEARLLRAWANLLLDRGALDRAEAHNARALHLLRLCGDREAEAVLLGNMGVVALEAARDAEARAALERALRLHTALGDRRHRAVVGCNLALLDHACGALEPAAERATQCLDAHRRMGNRRFEGFAHYILGGLAHERGLLDRALDHIGAAIALWQAVGERRYLGFGLCRLVMVEAERGATAAAAAAWSEARALLADPTDARFAAWALRLAAGHVESLPTGSTASFARISLRLLRAAARRG